jgi:hypothetical protein
LAKKYAEYIEQCFKRLRLSGTENPAARASTKTGKIAGLVRNPRAITA